MPGASLRTPIRQGAFEPQNPRRLPPAHPPAVKNRSHPNRGSHPGSVAREGQERLGERRNPAGAGGAPPVADVRSTAGSAPGRTACPRRNHRPSAWAWEPRHNRARRLISRFAEPQAGRSSVPSGTISSVSPSSPTAGAKCAKPLRGESFRGPPETSATSRESCRTPAVGRRPWPAGAPSSGHGAASVGETHSASAARERQTGRGPLGCLHTSARGCLSAGC